MNHHRYIINTSSPIAESRTGRILSAIDRLAKTTTTSTDSSSSSENEAEVALKFVFAPNSESNGLSHALLRESATWALLSAKAEMFEEKRTTTTDKQDQKLPILKLRDVFACGSSVVFVSKRMKSDLHSYLFSKNNKININLHTIKHIARRILVGLDFMHRECNVVHRDLKTSNIFVDCCCISNDLLPEVMIGDFGLSRVCSSSSSNRSKKNDDDHGDDESRTTTRPMTHEVVTRAYRPPELFLGCCQYHHQLSSSSSAVTTRDQQQVHPATSIDMWSFGCIMIDLLMSLTYVVHEDCDSNTAVHPPPSPLFASSSSSDIEQLSKIYDLIGTPSNDCQRKLLSMMKNNNSNNTNNSNNSIISFAPRAPYHPQWGEEIGKLYLSSEENDNNDQCKLFGDFIQRLLCNDPSDRMSAKECLDHAFLK